MRTEIERTDLFYNPLENPRVTRALSDVAAYLAGVLVELNHTDPKKTIDYTLNPSYDNISFSGTLNTKIGRE